MNSLRGRPEITAGDHPKTVYSALLSSIVFYNRTMPEDVAIAWSKTAQDAYEAIQDGFGVIDADGEPLKPNGSALLYMSLGQLGLALVSYGCDRLEEPGQPHAAEEVSNVNDLLNSIDFLRQ